MTFVRNIPNVPNAKYIFLYATMDHVPFVINLLHYAAPVPNNKLKNPKKSKKIQKIKK
jgi:hypothetical protein